MFRRLRSVGPSVLLGALAAVVLCAQVDADGRPRVVTQFIDESVTVELAGNTRPEANPGNDRGRVDDTLRLEHIQLLLKRPDSTEAQLRSRIDELHDHSSPRFHRWMTAESFGGEFGPAASDVMAVTDWLERRAA